MNQEQEPLPSEDADINGIEWLTVQQTAHRVQVHPRTIQKLIHDGKLKASRIGSALRIRKGDIDAFMESNRVN